MVADLLWGGGVAAALLAKGLCQRLPAVSTEERLASLPTRGLPITHPVTIHWNKYQAPFIEAETDEDLAVALGLVHAHLRLGQIEIMRRAAFGRVAEMIGPLGVEIDRSLRLLDVGRAVPKIAAALAPDNRRWIEGFVAGLNHYLSHAPSLPPEFAVLGLKPEPWTLEDLLTLMRFNSADISWLIWVRLLPVRARMPQGDWRQLWLRLLAGGAPPSLAGATSGRMERAMAETALAAATRSGSNSLAVAAGRSSNGGAMIASDPHLPLGLPNPWLAAGFKSPSYNAVGLMMPGLPFVALGRNPWMAWGGTSLHAQGSDLVDVSGLPATEFRDRPVTVRVRGGRPRRLRLRESPLGPVVSDGPLMANSQATALRWMGHRPSDEIGAMMAVARARDWDGFRTALSGFAVSGLNMVYAGSDGRVGHFLAAHLPRRRAERPADLIIPPDAADHWHDVVDGQRLPMRVDPADGVIVSANDAPDTAQGAAPDAGAFPIGFFFAPPDRVTRIQQLLGAHALLSSQDLQRVQGDVVVPGALALRDLLLAHAPQAPAHQSVHALVDTLRQWDGSYDQRQPGALAFELVLAGVARELGRARLVKPYQIIWHAQSLLLEDFQRADPAALRRGVERSLTRAARTLARLGTWGRFHQFRLQHPFGRLPLVGRRFRLPPFPADGGNNSVYKAGHAISDKPHGVSFGSCARHISELKDADANRFVLLGGQDGWLGSANYADQIDLWRQGGYMTLPLRPETARAAFPHKTYLRPRSPDEAPSAATRRPDRPF
ncbi:penicillin acylase family protein [Nitrospirillum sp. BR 11752]|uniref:penicillin acylase family protein n=1 Tax=Nitrospirillum sp. BR 11752 TaxID=3104293 RepID=UPI002EA92DDD|nr:penicillin acylase family protein [Nitrospirillum sp. BR 11752]